MALVSTAVSEAKTKLEQAEAETQWQVGQAKAQDALQLASDGLVSARRVRRLSGASSRRAGRNKAASAPGEKVGNASAHTYTWPSAASATTATWASRTASRKTWTFGASELTRRPPGSTRHHRFHKMRCVICRKIHSGIRQACSWGRVLAHAAVTLSLVCLLPTSQHIVPQSRRRHGTTSCRAAFPAHLMVSSRCGLASARQPVLRPERRAARWLCSRWTGGR